MNKSPFVIPLVFLLAGFIIAYFIFSDNKIKGPNLNAQINQSSENSIANPFVTENDSTLNSERLLYLEDELRLLKKQLTDMNLTLKSLTESTENKKLHSQLGTLNKKTYTSSLTRRLYNQDNLIRGGIDSSLAEDIVRRKNTVELKRLALQDRATRDNYLNTQRYYDELDDINKQDVSLREELGDDRYDQYLFDSKQNNRVKISSVMLGSAAEQVGIKKGDIILSYDNQRLFNWQELKDATAEGQLGEYISININRRGEIFSFSVPRGPLGIQLGAARLAP